MLVIYFPSGQCVCLHFEHGCFLLFPDKLYVCFGVFYCLVYRVDDESQPRLGIIGEHLLCVRSLVSLWLSGPCETWNLAGKSLPLS